MNKPRRSRLAAGTCCRVFVLLLAVGLACGVLQGCKRKEVPRSAENNKAEETRTTAASPATRAARPKSREVYATWYDVPADSLAKRRAGLHELTAAHNRLPLGTLVRVTHLANAKEVTVRITDRGIRSRKVKLDVCKEAAEELEMLSKGIARVRMEVLPDDQGASPQESLTATP